MRNSRRILFALVFMLLPGLAFADGPRIEQFSPQGEIKKVRQVQARFSAPMAAFGDPRLADPFDVKCPRPGKGRWVDSRNWVFDFDEDLPAGLICAFTLKPDVKTLAGEPLGGDREFVFNTGGPAVIESEPEEGEYSSISEEPAFILLLDAAPLTESVMDHVAFAVEGIEERIGAALPTEAERLELLNYYRKRYRYVYDEIPDSGLLPNALQLFFIKASRTFPSDATVKLIWGRGVKSTDGVETSQDQVLTFKVRPEFRIAFSCPRENAKSGCIPCLDMELEFNAPVKADAAANFRLRSPKQTWAPKIEEGQDTIWRIRFPGPFPEKETLAIDLPEGLTDDAGRVPANREKFPLKVATGVYPPLAKFSSRFGILEKANPVLPVTLRDLDPAIKARVATQAPAAESETTGLLRRFEDEIEIIDRLFLVRKVDRRHSLFAGDKNTRRLAVPRRHGRKAFEVVGIPLGKPGLYLVELESPVLGAALLGERRTMYVPTAALVTNLSVHFKNGRQSSLVWVTTLDSAEPVPNAAITIRNDQGEILWQGKSDDRGIAVVDLDLEAKQGNPFLDAYRADPKTGRAIGKYERDGETHLDYPQLGALDSLNYGFFVFARTADDLSFVHSSWDRGIENWRFEHDEGESVDAFLVHTVFDRTLLRAGETVSMKHFIRQHAMDGFQPPDKKDLPTHVVIRHQGGMNAYSSEEDYDVKVPLVWDASQGIAESVWAIPADARLGTYTVAFDHEDLYYNDGGSFRVEEFRIPMLKGSIQPAVTELAGASDADVDLLVSYLSGGGASGLPVKLRALIEPRHVRFDDYDGYVFGTGGVKQGVQTETDDDTDDGNPPPKKTLPSQDLALGPGGALRARIGGIPPSSRPRTLLAELEFRDPAGEIQTISRSMPLWPAKLLLGLKPDSWTSVKDNVVFTVAAVDPSGKPAAGVKINVNAFQRKRYSHRRRHIGGFYSYEHSSEVIRLDRLAEGITDERGLLHCRAVAPVSGELILQAEAADANGSPAVVNRTVWVAGGEEWWFRADDSDRIDVLPEKKHYAPGETAVFQVRMPFREATVLVTVEREGVMDAFIQKISGTDAVIRVPIKGTYAPNVFVSAFCVRGRAADFAPTALVDLGKPAYKMGVAEIRVDWQRHTLNVNVASPRDVYAIREKVPVTIQVKTADGSPLTGPAEAAVAVVDEGLLELMPNDSWDLLTAMMGRRPYEVETSTAQGQVVGRRHYGLKALPQGGGGGAMATREMFDTLLLWQGRVPLDADGRADLEIPLNDSLTSFRIVAVASAGSDRFGTGHTTIRTTKDLMLIAGLPPVVREGDRFRAGFTVRNASGRKMKVRIEARLRYNNKERDLSAITRRLKPGEASDIGWTIDAPEKTAGLEWEVAARERKGDGRDAVRIRQKVVPAVPVRVIQATLGRLDKPLLQKVSRPVDALPGQGGLAIGLSPTLTNALTGVDRYMREYPFNCMEQRVSQAIALGDEALWKGIVDDLPRYLDGDGLVKYFTVCGTGSDVLTSYLLAIADEAGRDIPEGLKKRMEDALTRFVEGRVIRHSAIPAADVSIRKLAALEALSRNDGATPGMLASIAVEPNLWPTSAVLDWIGLLTRVQEIPDSAQLRDQAAQILRARMNLRGTSLGFSTEDAGNLWWLMVSGDVNAVRAVLVLFELAEWQADLPRLVQGAVARQQRGRWNTTTANAWGVLALAKFSRTYESTPVEGVTTAALGAQQASCSWNNHPPMASLMLDWPKKAADLSLGHSGGGAPWVTIQSLAAIPLREPLYSGYRIRKTLSPVEQRQPGQWQTGDVARVRLEMEAQADMTWVALTDPIPAGANILGTGLGRDSRILAEGGTPSGGSVWPTFEERSFEAFRAYYEYVPKGNWFVEYTVRFNQEGEFRLPPTRVEALYAPEMFGEIPNELFKVKAGK